MEKHVPFKHRRTTLERAEKFISSHYFTDINLRSRLYPARAAITSLTHYAAPGRITYEEAVKGDYQPVTVGQSFGPTWATHWFRVEIRDLPADWLGKEVRLVWNSNSEALVWQGGLPRQGLSADKERYDFVLSKKLEKNQSYTLYVEMACNKLLGAGEHLVFPPDPNQTFRLDRADIAVFDREVYNLILDMEVLHGMAKELPDNDRGYQALYAANDFVNACDVKDPSTYKRAKAISEKFFSQKNGDTQHTTYAMGHSHIDTAWLWPYDETKRKCCRSWSCTLRLMEQYPDFKFTCSQAQQFAWMKELYPSLFKDICKFVANGQFVPVGGTWVEMDGYVPSGEAFVRQFLYGQKFFQKEFGLKCTEFWLPDTFGYAAQLPQIMRNCGISRFVTQKMSWNLVNKFPHHTFWWEGLDNSRVLAHFPPGDNYCNEGTVKEVLYTANNFRDKGRSSRSMFLFGYGDGGNGPDEHMIQRLKRMQDIDGLPRVKLSTPSEFFAAVEQEETERLCTWRGELYLEMHNGTYTTHAKVKERNRRCEFLLQDVEQAWALALAQKRGGSGGRAGDAPGSPLVYPRERVERLWKLLLLNQFHDVLPGSSITMVYDDAHRFYKAIEEEGAELLNKAFSMLGSDLARTEQERQMLPTPSDLPLVKEGKGSGGGLVVNTLGWPRSAVVALPADKVQQPAKRRKTVSQVDSEGNTLELVKVGSCSVSSLESCVHAVQEEKSVQAKQQGDCILLSNVHLSATLDSAGRLTSLRCAGSSRELLLEGCHGNQLLLYDDVPLFWDAWDVMDYHLETRKPLEQVIQKAKLIDCGPLRARVEVKLRISADSTLTQIIQLDAGSPYIEFQTQVEWQENRKLLKVEFPSNISSLQATYDVQYGALQRPNHYNTSWDSARYEVCAQKWVDISEFGAGLSLLTDSKYGYSAVGGILRISLLRAPKAPDAFADMGSHKFSYAVMPHTGSWQAAGVVQAAFNLNRPLHILPVSPSSSPESPPSSFFWLDSTQVVLDTIKPAEEGEAGSLVARLYEAFGGQASVTLSTSLPVTSAHSCNCLEEPLERGEITVSSDLAGSRSVNLRFTPFQIVTLRLTCQ